VRSFLLTLAGMALLPIAATPAQAAGKTLTIALSSEPTAADPHYHDLTPNNALGKEIFGTLVMTDENQNVVPALASSWKAADDHTWIINLRRGVKFSDGKPFTADDAVFTFCRVVKNTQSITGAFSPIIANFAAVETPDDHTLKIVTKAPEPLMPEKLMQISIISSATAQHGRITFDLDRNCGVTGPWPTIAQFNSGEAAISSGPFKLVKFVKGSVIEMERNPNYWGPKPEWDTVRLVPVPSGGPRLAGLLAGDYDMIDGVSARDANTLKANPAFGIKIKASNRVIFLQLDVARDQSPYVEAPDGKNPLKDVRVRRAISLAINRDVIVKRIMDGAADPASQFVPEMMFGAMPKPEPLTYDPQQAKKLLAEAGYPKGFKITLSATNDRYINDSQVAQAIAQYLNQVGIRTEVDAMTRSIFFSRRSKREFSLSMGGWGSASGGAESFLRQFVATTNRESGYGTSNYGGWSDPKFDAVIAKASATMDETERAAGLREAGRMAMASLPDIPIHFESSIWAFKKGLAYPGRLDQATLAQFVTSAK